jgi:hypothetical protein
VVTAWTVPVVQAVAAVPAFATSGPPDISVTPVTSASVTFSSGSGGNKNFRVDVTVMNIGGSTTDGLVATLKWSPLNGDNKRGTLGTVGAPIPTAAWKGSGTSWSAGPLAVGKTQSFTLTGTINKHDAGHSVAGTLMVTFMASGKAPSVSGTTS